MVDYTVIVVTHNRRELLRETLAVLSRLSYAGTWECIVVDNNSTENIKDLVEDTAATFPVNLRYLFEGTPGKYWALNTGIQGAEGHSIAATDDDAYPEPDWLERAEEGFTEYECDFVGGLVDPVWRAQPPAWIDQRNSICGKVLGLQDHGPEPREYGVAGLSWPLGVNVAYRRSAFERVGLFDGRLGRVAGTLRNQSQREWHLRARAAGLRGMYLPRMIVHHSVEAERLTRHYFHRWFYWHGVSRAILYRNSGRHLLDPESGETHVGERHLLRVPESIWRTGVLAAASAARRWLWGRSGEAITYELTVCFCAGVIRELWRDGGAAARRGTQPAPGEFQVPSMKARPGIASHIVRL